MSKKKATFKHGFKVGDAVIDTDTDGFATSTVTKVSDDEIFETTDEDGERMINIGVETFVKATKANIAKYDKRIRISKKFSDDLHAFAAIIMNQMPDLQKHIKKLKPKQRNVVDSALDSIASALVDIREHYKVD